MAKTAGKILSMLMAGLAGESQYLVRARAVKLGID